MILVPLPYKLYGFVCLCLNMENLLYKSKSEHTRILELARTGGGKSTVL